MAAEVAEPCPGPWRCPSCGTEIPDGSVRACSATPGITRLECPKCNLRCEVHELALTGPGLMGGRTPLDEEKAKHEHVLGLLRDSRMKHGVCRPRSRKACTACNATEELDKIVAAWKGFTLHPS